MKVGLVGPLGVPDEYIDKLSQPIKDAGHEFVYFNTKTKDPQELIARSAGCEVVMVDNTPYPDAVVNASKDLKMLAVAFTGIDHVGLDACRSNGVTVCNCAGYSNQCVAEMAIGMAIAMYRKMTVCDKTVREGGTSAGLTGLEIAGKTVGIIGCGNIGFMTAKMFKAFGAKVIVCANHEKDEVKAEGFTYVSVDELLKESDIVSLHTPNNASTKGMISAEKIALMKPNAIFINCARGPIVDNKALADALNAGKIAGAAIDVYDMEPPIPADYPLVNAKNTILTPHVAFLTHEAMVRRADIEFANVMAYINGKPENVCKL